MKRLLAAWNAYWFAPMPYTTAAICRIVLVGAQLLVFLPPLDTHLREVCAAAESSPEHLGRTIAILVPDWLLADPGAVTVAYAVTVTCGTAALLGLLTRGSMLLFGVGSLLLHANLVRYGQATYPEPPLLIANFLLALSPCGRALSVDALLSPSRPAERGSLWSLRLGRVHLAMVYLSAGLSKLTQSGLAWFDGQTLQQFLLQDATWADRAAGLWLAQQHGLCRAIGVAVVVLEVTFPLACLWRRAAPFYLAAGAALHHGVYAFQGVAFFQFVCLYVLFLDGEGLRLLDELEAGWRWLGQRLERVVAGRLVIRAACAGLVAAAALAQLGAASRPEPVWAVAVAPRSGAVVTAQGRRVVVREGARTRSWDAHRIVRALAVSADGRVLASGGLGKRRQLRLWELATGRELSALEGHEPAVSALAFSPDGTLLASGGYDRRVLIWRAVRAGDWSHVELQHTLADQPDEVTALAFSRDGGELASAYQDGSVRLWDVRTAALGATLQARGSSALSYAEGGRVLVSAGDRGIESWDLSSLARLASVPLHPHGPVASVALSARADALAVGGFDGSLRWRALPAIP